MSHRLFEGTDFSHLTGEEVREHLTQAVRGELEACARMADAIAERFQKSSRNAEGMVALELAAKIRDRAARG